MHIHQISLHALFDYANLYRFASHHSSPGISGKYDQQVTSFEYSRYFNVTSFLGITADPMIEQEFLRSRREEDRSKEILEDGAPESKGLLWFAAATKHGNYYRLYSVEPRTRDRRTIAQDRVLYVVQETGESGEWRSAGSVGSLYPYRSAAENSGPPLTWKSAVCVNVGPGARVARYSRPSP